MEDQPDIRKVVRQHLEMEQFLTGFALRGEPAASEVENQEDNMAVAEKAAELEKIAEEVRQCCKCDLGSSRTNAVPGEGNPDARIMFVGEAPGADEDAQGRPFVGRKCRPPDNRDPRAEEIISCLPYLQRQIEIIEPEVLVALGAHAAKTLLNTAKSIGQLRGQFHEYYSGLGRPPVKLMATYHTAYLLRNYSPENRRKVWEDMKKVLAELDLPIPK
ncbi:MAG: uracil-DNA glycosylase [Planctomycetota bacterium]|jgi:DNA polymerase